VNGTINGFEKQNMVNHQNHGETMRKKYPVFKTIGKIYQVFNTIKTMVLKPEKPSKPWPCIHLYSNIYCKLLFMTAH
jgi:hypothetical protein